MLDAIRQAAVKLTLIITLGFTACLNELKCGKKN